MTIGVKAVHKKINQEEGRAIQGNSANIIIYVSFMDYELKVQQS